MADETTKAEEKAEEKDTEQEQQEQKDEKTFTQAELDAVVQDRLSKAKKGMPTKEELAAFKAWQEGQKTEEQKKGEADQANKEALTAAEKKAAAAEARAACLEAGVAKDFAADVVLLAQAMVTEDLDINAAIAKVVEKYPAFKAATAPPVTVTTGARTEQAPSGASDDAARRAMGLPPKK